MEFALRHGRLDGNRHVLDRQESLRLIEALNEELRLAKQVLDKGGVTVVDGQGETPVLTDGPYLETKEIIGGFWVIDAPDLDVALRLAAEGSKACRGKVEVRPFEGLA